MEPIYPITALQKKTAEVKSAADRGVVRITENGAGAYVFCSEAVFAKTIEDAINAAIEEVMIANAIERGRADLTAGRYIDGSDAAWAEIERRAELDAYA